MNNNISIKERIKNMTLVFEDNFDTPELDMTKWDFTDYMAGYRDMPSLTNSEVQAIKKDKEGNSYLHLVAKRTGKNTFQTVKSITTGNKLTFLYGYAEIRAKVPTVQGAWPSFWFKSNTQNPHLGWREDVPYGIEVDVFEVMGGNAAISELHKWDHTQATFDKIDTRYGQYSNRNSYAINDNDWHTYGMLWNENHITMYVDGVEIQAYDLNKDFGPDYVSGMNGFKKQPMCIILNNHLFTPEFQKTQISGWTDDKVLDEGFTESVYDIDYVRLYQDKDGILYKAD